MQERTKNQHFDESMTTLGKKNASPRELKSKGFGCGEPLSAYHNCLQSAHVLVHQTVPSEVQYPT